MHEVYFVGIPLAKTHPLEIKHVRGGGRLLATGTSPDRERCTRIVLRQQPIKVQHALGSQYAVHQVYAAHLGSPVREQEKLT